MNALAAYLQQSSREVETLLDSLLPSEQTRPAILHQAMRYSLFAGGKRLRPALCFAACEACGGTRDQAVRPAAALEVLHTYTLIHDDLPGTTFSNPGQRGEYDADKMAAAIEDAVTRLLERADAIPSPNDRAAFLTALRDHAETLALAATTPQT